MSQELVNSVNKLTDETSALLQEYVKGNTVLQNSASEAASSAAAAKVSEGITIDKANVATQKAAEAKQFRDETAAVATGGTATLDPTPGKIPLADAEAKIHAGWLPVNVSSLSEAIVNAISDVNKEQYAASGFIHTGKHFNSGNLSSVNEGMTVDIGTPNVIYLGARDGVTGGNVGGSSKTSYPVMNVAGFEVHLLGINSTLTNWQANTIKLPVEPNGTVVSDSSGNCRGTGKPTLDLSKEVDPKYGNVASSVNEAVARAFEGSVKNGDFRNGQASWGGSDWVFSGGTAKTTRTGFNALVQTVPTKAGTQYRVTVSVKDWVGQNYTINASSVGNSGALEGKGDKEFIFTAAGSTTVVDVRPFSGGQAGLIELSSFTITPLTEEVVTDRVDMFGIEGYLEKANGTLYPYGCIQGQLTTVDGVATEVDNSRPNTYFAAYTGDTTSRGRRWDLSKLTFVQMATIMSNPDHNAYYTKEGELVQFRVRQRTIAGVGNGDWGNINPNTNDVLFNHGPVIKNRVAAQGVNDTPIKPSVADDGFYGSLSTKGFQEQGVFSTSKSSTAVTALNGECYFYVMGTVPRLNQGAYHPNFNPMGAAALAWRDSAIGQVEWYSSALAKPVTSTSDCFIESPSGGSKSTAVKTGAIGAAAGFVARPDGKFYDAIYASGQGGVIDFRMSAWDMSSKEEAAKIFQKVVNGSYRGLEKLVKTTPYGSEEGAAYQGLIQGMYKWNATGPDFVISQGTLGVEGADAPLLGWLVQEGKLFPVTYMFQTSGSDTTQIYCGKNTWERYAEGKIVTNIVSDKPLYFMHIAETNLSVSGDFTQLDVIGSPAEILKVDALKNGWMGGWRLSGVSNRAGLTRKALSSYNARMTTENSGATWTPYSHALDTAINSVYTAVTPTNTTVEVHPYTVFAKQTKPGTNKSVLNSSEGVGDVYAMDRYTTFNGASFVESLIGKVPISSSTRTYAELMLQEATKTNESKLAFVSHSPLVLDAPTNNSPAVKALWHQASNNRQATLNFLWNELVFDVAWRTPDKVWSGGSVAVAAGETFRAESSSAYAVAGLLMRCVKAVTANATILGAMHVTRTGEVISLTDGLTYFKVINDGWSDDSTIRIIDGVGTFNNENGDTCLYGISELAMPYGYTKNQAGAGKQVVGVDL